MKECVLEVALLREERWSTTNPIVHELGNHPVKNNYRIG